MEGISPEALKLVTSQTPDARKVLAQKGPVSEWDTRFSACSGLTGCGAAVLSGPGPL